MTNSANILRTSNRSQFDDLCLDEGDECYIEQWKTDSYPSWAYYIMEEGEIVSFACLRKCDFDPFGTHLNPTMLNFVWTDPTRRGEGYATKLINFLKKNHEMTTICVSDSEALFKKLGFLEVSGIMRYPR